MRTVKWVAVLVIIAAAVGAEGQTPQAPKVEFGKNPNSAAFGATGNTLLAQCKHAIAFLDDSTKNVSQAVPMAGCLQYLTGIADVFAFLPIQAPRVCIPE